MNKIYDYLFQALEQKNVDTKKIQENITDLKNLIFFLVNRHIVKESSLIQYIAKLLREGKVHIDDVEELPDVIKDKVLEAYAKLSHIEYVDLDSIDIDLSLAAKIPLTQLKKHLFLPIKQTDINVTVAIIDPLDIDVQEVVQRQFPNKLIKYVLASKVQIQSVIAKLELSENIKEYVEEIKKDLERGVADKENIEESSAILKLIEAILKTAIVSRASDIHIEPTESTCVVRTRIDGILTEKFLFEKDIYPPLASRLKLLANLDIAERRKPQDGRFAYQLLNKEFDFRISTLPIVHGESIVMRILDKTKAMIPLEDAGMSAYNYELFVKSLKSPYGIILVTGPTGSGKTTTLYGALNMVKSVEKKIITVEDPVEYQLPLIQQCQVNPKIGFTFASALRSILRQDPDVIMIGEIRDEETLRIAIQAALTGHLVLSTLHTNDAISAINRIIDMGIESYLVSGALVAIEAQRLVRRICPNCKEETIIDPVIYEDLREFFPKSFTIFKGKGCKQCDFTGYQGREMISEVFVIDDEIARLIAKEASKEQLYEIAQKKGFKNMLQDGINKVLEGSTTIEEVLRVTRL